MMLLGWESNAGTWLKSAKLEGESLSLGVGNPRFPTLCMKLLIMVQKVMYVFVVQILGTCEALDRV